MSVAFDCAFFPFIRYHFWHACPFLRKRELSRHARPVFATPDTSWVSVDMSLVSHVSGFLTRSTCTSRSCFLASLARKSLLYRARDLPQRVSPARSLSAKPSPRQQTRSGDGVKGSGEVSRGISREREGHRRSKSASTRKAPFKALVGGVALIAGVYFAWPRQGVDIDLSLVQRMSAETFSTCRLLSREDGFGGNSIFQINLHPDVALHIPTISKNGQCDLPDYIWSVRIKQPLMQIERDYTPLPPLPGKKDEPVRFWIKNEPDGLMSNWLFSLIPLHRYILPARSDANAPGDLGREGTKIEVRGPFQSCAIPDSIKQVVFFAGGTGIAPGLQVADILSSRQNGEDDKGCNPPKMTIVWANRDKDATKRTGQFDVSGAQGDERGVSSSHVSPASQLEMIRHYGRETNGFEMETKLFVDSDRSFIQRRDVARALRSVAPQNQEGGFLDWAKLTLFWGRAQGDNPRNGRSGEKMVIVSGSDGFVEYIAGPKIIGNGAVSQGQVGGLLGQCNTEGWQVVKL